VADGGYLTLGGPLSGGVAMSVVKQGLGTLGLRDSAGFGGGTTIAAGTLVAQHASALGGGGVLVNDGASLLIDSVTLTTGGLTLNGRGVQEGGALQGAGTAAHAGAVTLATASAIGAAAGSTLTLNNPLTGPGGLAKVGSGRLDLTAGSSYAGGTTIEAGTLVAQHASALGGGGARQRRGVAADRQRDADHRRADPQRRAGGRRAAGRRHGRPCGRRQAGHGERHRRRCSGQHPDLEQSADRPGRPRQGTAAGST
jgi:autotransporter-associated beta strand protein